MDKDIEIVPAIRRIRLKHFGCWDNFCRDFTPGLNIITEENNELGKSTILQAIVMALQPLALMQYSVTHTTIQPRGEIAVELMSPNISRRIEDCLNVPLDKDDNESQGQYSLRRLRLNIESVPPGMAILVEDDVTGRLDERLYARVVKLLNTARCQVIAIIAGWRLDPNQFKKARIYACGWDRKRDRATMSLRLAGQRAERKAKHGT